jgi:hypothetical protein
MTTCTVLSDRMPGVALGRERWTAGEARHLSVCADCRAEWELVAATSRLGASSPGIVDPSLISARVLARIAAERRDHGTRRRHWVMGGLAAAAALALAVWTGHQGTPGAPAGGGPPTAATMPVATAPTPAPSSPAGSRGAAVGRVELPIPELDDLPVEALDSMLRVLDEPLAQTDVGGLRLDDDGDRELEQALAGLEG